MDNLNVNIVKQGTMLSPILCEKNNENRTIIRLPKQ